MPQPAFAVETLPGSNETYRYVPIGDLPGLDRLPYSLRVIVENLARQSARNLRSDAATLAKDIDNVLNRRVGAGLAFYPNRIFSQDILGLVMLVDIAALRDAVAEAGKDPATVEPKVPIDIIIDHSLQVDVSGVPDAARINLETEYARNAERFTFLRWCQNSFDGVRVVPPGKGHHAPDQLGAYRTGRVARGNARRHARLPGYAGRDGQPYPDDQWPRHSRLGSRRAGGGSRHGRQAGRHRLARGGRRRVERAAPRRCNTNRSRPRHHGKDARDGGRWKVRRILRQGPRHAIGRRPRHHRETWPRNSGRPPFTSRSTRAPSTTCA